MNNQGPNSSLSNKILSKLQGIDRYGTQITLTLDKKQKFTTAFGGCLSIITWIGALGYFAYCLYRVDSHEYQMASIDGYKGEVLDINHNMTGHFDAAFQVQYAGPNYDVYMNMDTYFTMYVQQFSQSTDLNTGRPSMKTLREYNMMPCTDDRFGQDLISEAQSLGISKYWCINGTELHIQNGKKLFAVYFDYCNQTFLDIMHPGKGLVCKTIAQINPEIPFVALFRYFKNSYLDYNEFDKNPVKGVLRNKAHQVFPYKTIQHTVLATRHTAYLKDDKFSSYGRDTEHTFYDFDSVKMELAFDYNPYDRYQADYFPNGLPLLQFDFEINAYYTKKYRKVMTILDAVAQTGGIMGVLVGFGAILNGLFQSALYKLKMIGLLYTTTKYQKAKARGNLNDFSKDFQPNNSMRALKKTNHDSSDSNSKNKNKSNSPQNSLIGDIINKIMTSRPLIFHKWSIIWHELSNKFYFCRKGLDQKFKEYALADLKMNHELDVVHIIKKMRQVDVLTKILVNINQQQLLKFGEDSTITLKEESQQISQSDSLKFKIIEKQLGELEKRSAKSNNAKQLMQLLSGQNQHGSTTSSEEKLYDSLNKLKSKKSEPVIQSNNKNKKQSKVSHPQVNINFNDGKLDQNSEQSQQLFEQIINQKSNYKVKNQKHKNHKQRRPKDCDSERQIPVEQYQTPTEDIQEERTSPKNSKYNINKNIIKISE
eukprot:403375326